MLYVCTKSSKSRNLKNSKKVEILYIFFNRFTKQRKEKFLYTLFIFHHRARVISLGATICPKISKIPKISNFSQLHLIYPGKLILRSSLIYSPPKHVSRKSSTLYFAYNNTTTPVLSFFFSFLLFFFSISKSTTGIHQRDLRLVAHLSPPIFLLQTHTWHKCDFSELIDNIYANSFVTKDPSL